LSKYSFQKKPFSKATTKTMKRGVSNFERSRSAFCGDPLTEAFRATRELAAGDLLVVRASFRPEPLREALTGAGHRVFVRGGDGGGFELVVAR
jgi:hypothetical protein